MKNAHVKKGYTAALLLSALLAACGGGGAEAPDAAAAADGRLVPASALVSAGAFSAYAASLALTESGEALWISDMVAPTSETDAPMLVK